VSPCVRDRWRTRSWGGMSAPSAVARRSTIRSITSRFWRANRAPCATEPRSRTGTCHRPCAGCSARSNASPAATGRWSRSSGPCSPTGWRPSKPPAPRLWPTTSIPPVFGMGLGPMATHASLLNILARRHARGVLPARRTATAPDNHDAGCVAPEARVPRDSWAASPRPIAIATTA
jgi:hypothetical protein